MLFDDIVCQTDDVCPFLFSCQENYCQHNSLFSFTVYTGIIYLLIPFCSSLVNMTGNSMGIFKVLILVNLLRYSSNQSTALIQPMVAGTAIPNFFNLIRKRHPKIQTSLINFNIIYVIIPSSLLGSTIGSLIKNFIPELFQDIMIVVIFSYFAFKFVKKAQSIGVIAKVQQKPQQNDDIKAIKQQLLDGQKKEIIEQYQLSQQMIQKGLKIKQYEKGLHLRDIAMSFVIFIVFEVLVFFVQGKLGLKFTKCDLLYIFGLVLLIIITIIYLMLTKKIMKKKFQQYKQVRFQQDIDLGNQKNYWLLSLGGFGAGCLQGIVGVGSGSCTMAVLLAINLPPRVASAISGYQIFFIGSGSLIQELINQQIQLAQVGFLFGICAVLGGILTTLFHYIVQKAKNQDKVNRILVYCIAVLCMISVIGVFPSAYLTISAFGFGQMMRITFSC